MSLVAGGAYLMGGVDTPEAAPGATSSPSDAARDAEASSAPTVSSDATTDQTPASPTTEEADPLPFAINAVYENQPCSSQYVVVLATSGLSWEWESKLGAAVDGVPGAKVLKGAGSCSAFLRKDPSSGEPIFNAYTGPFPDLATACAAQSSLGPANDKAWVRKLDDPSKVRELCFCLDSAESLPTYGGPGDAVALSDRRLVAQVQWAFFQMGLNDIDHIYGNFTSDFRTQIEAFQVRSGVRRTGAIDPPTWRSLQASYCGPDQYLAIR